MPSVHTSKKPVVNISQAHKNCVRWAKQEGWSEVNIWEDDIKFTSEGSYQRFLNLKKDLPVDWNIYLSGVYEGKIYPITEELAQVREFSGLHCYMVSHRFYDTFLGADENTNLDKWIGSKRHGNYLSHLCYPMVAIQHDGFSDNIRMSTNYNHRLINKYKLWQKE